MNINYRDAVEEERSALEELSRESTTGRLCDYGDNKEGLFDVNEYTKTGGNMWVAEDLDNKSIVGSIAVRFIDESTGKIKALRVHPDYRRNGIARKLIEILEGYCKEKQHLNVILGVGNDSLAAIKLYESLGFVRYEEKEVEPGNSIFYYRKQLSAE